MKSLRLLIGLLTLATASPGPAEAPSAPPAGLGQEAPAAVSIRTLSPPDWKKLEVADRELAPRLRAAGGRMIGDYDAYQLWWVPAAEVPALSPLSSVREHPAEDVLELHAGWLRASGDTAAPAAAEEPAGPGRRLGWVQFAGPMKPEWHAALRQAGLRVVAHVPRRAYLVYGDDTAFQAWRKSVQDAAHVQWQDRCRPEHKLHPSARAALEQGTPGQPLFAVQLVHDPDRNAETLRGLEEAGATLLSRQRVLGYVNLVLRLSPARVMALAERPDVISVRLYIEPRRHDERQGMIVAGQIHQGQPAAPGYLAWLADRGLDPAQFAASALVVDIADGGVDNGTLAPAHPNLYVLGRTNLAPRLVYHHFVGRPGSGPGDLADCDGHGTLNAHIVAGYSDRPGFPHTDAAGYHYGLGIAPFVRVGSSVIFAPGFTYPDLAELLSRAYQAGARVTCNSWGAPAQGDYNEEAQTYDALVRDAQPEGSPHAAPGNQAMVVVFSAGNSGPGLGTLGAPGTAKNVITVGASENVHSHGLADGCGTEDSAADSAEDVAYFSSRGPCRDGRVKPDLLAPGTHVTGGVPQAPAPGPLGQAAACFAAGGVCALPGGGTAGSTNNFYPPGQQFYTTSSGTSHACPAVGGGAALLRQWFLNRGWAAPSPALTKAWLLNAARYLTGAGANDSLPSPNQGHGALDLGRALDAVPRVFRDQVAADKFTASGQTRVFRGVVADAQQPFRVTLAWTDAPGAVIGSAYNNDLDLIVTVQGQTYRGNVFAGPASVPGGASDRVNNVESVFLPAGTQGPFTITVVAADINSDGVPQDADPLDQDFALVAYNASDRDVWLEGVGASLVAESCEPGNGGVDPGETVTVRFGVRNLGWADTAHLVGTLLPGAGVLAPGEPQSFGVVQAGGPVVSRDFSFTALGPCGGWLAAAIHFHDGSRDLGVQEYRLRLGGQTAWMGSFAQSLPIDIRAEDGAVSPYPSALPVSGVVGRVSRVTLTLRELSHTWLSDLRVLLVAPDGRAVAVLAGAGGSQSVSNLTLTLDDAAAAGLPDHLPVTSGTWQPTSREPVGAWPTPAPAGPYARTLSALAGAEPNGLWQLFVADAYPSDDGGVIRGGWMLHLTTTNSVCCLPTEAADLALAVNASRASVRLLEPLAYMLTVSNAGPSAATGVTLTSRLPPNVRFIRAESSAGACGLEPGPGRSAADPQLQPATAGAEGGVEPGGVVRCELGTLPLGARAEVVLWVEPRGGPLLNFTASAAARQRDFHPANNEVTEVTTVALPVLTIADVAVLEGHTGQSLAFFTARLSEPVPVPVEVDYETRSGTAEAGVDFLSRSNRLLFLPGEAVKTIEVPVVGDTLAEEDETFYLLVTQARNACPATNQALGIILNDDFGPRLELAGYRLTAESQTPPNGEVDPGETVTLRVAVRNQGAEATSDLVVTLLAGEGLEAPSAPAEYGAVAPGAQVSRPFTFTAALRDCGALRATFRFTDGARVLGQETLFIPVGGEPELFLVGLGTNQLRRVQAAALTGGGAAGGLALSGQHVWLTGDEATARWGREDLTGGVGLGARHTALVSDLRSETVYVLAHGGAELVGGLAGEVVTELLELDDETGAPSGRRVALSAPIALTPGAGLFAGFGRVVIWDGAHAHDVALPSGAVTDLGPVSLWPRPPSQAWAFWGVAEWVQGEAHLVYVAEPATVVRTRLRDGLTTPLGAWPALGRLWSLVVSPRQGRWYFQTEGASQSLGMAEAVLAVQCGPRPPVFIAHPEARATVAGGLVAFSGAALGRAPLGYQWRKDGWSLPAANQPTLHLTNVQPRDAGDYALVASNAFGAVTSATARLVVIEALPQVADDFEAGPDHAQWLNYGGTGGDSFGAGSVSGTNALWFGGAGERFALCFPVNTTEGGWLEFQARLLGARATVVLECSTNAGLDWAGLGVFAGPAYAAWTPVALVLPPEAQGAATLFRWRQPAEADACCDPWALDDVRIVGLPPQAPPHVVAGPRDQSLVEGDSLTFEVVAAGAPPLRFAWLKDGTRLAGATGASWHLPQVRLSDTGQYQAVVSNAFGAVTSAVARLTVRPAVFLGVFADPAYVDTSGTFAAEADTAQATLRLLGYRPRPFVDLEAALAGESVLLFPDLELADPTPAWSPAARAGLSNFVACGGGLIVLGGGAHSVNLLNAVLGWRLAGVAGPSAAWHRTVAAATTEFAECAETVPTWSTVSPLRADSLPPGSLALYTNGVQTAVALLPVDRGWVAYLGWDWHDAAPLGTQDGGWLALLHSAVRSCLPPPAQAPPEVSLWPAGQTVVAGQSAFFVARARGTPPLAWQWFKDGWPVSGGHERLLAWPSVAPSDAGDYTVRVTNLFGSVTSVAARLAVRPAHAVGLFKAPAFVDTDGGRGSESDTVQASLVRIGFSAWPFTNVAGAVALHDVLLVPEQERAALAPALAADEAAALSNFVHCGGVLIVLGGSGDRAAELLNRVADLRLTERLANVTYARTAQAEGTEFADAPATLPGQSAVTALDEATLPPGARAIYTHGTLVAVALLPLGQGQMVFLGWDWFNAVPLGTADGGWLSVLTRAVWTAGEPRARPPAIIGPPEDQMAVAGFPVSFAVGAAGTPPLQYQWRKDGADLPGARQAVWTIPEAQPADAGSYVVVITNLYGAVTSAVATLTLPERLLVSVFHHPRYVNTGTGPAAEADAVCAALEHLGYLPEPITRLGLAAERRPILHVPSLVKGEPALELPVPDQAALSNAVTHGSAMIVHGGPSGRVSRWLNQVFGFRLSEVEGAGGEFRLDEQAAGTGFAEAPATLPALANTFALVSGSLPAGARRIYTRGSAVAVALLPVGAGTLTYLGWDWRGGVPLGPEDGGWLAVLDRAMRVSAVATSLWPVFVRQPQSQTAPVGGQVMFEVGVRGRGPFAYQWRKEGVPISGAHEAVWTLAPVQADAWGRYDVIVATGRGAVSSAPAWLRVFTPGMDLFDDFEPDADPAQWAELGGAAASEHGGKVSGTAALWFGGEGLRHATTRLLDTTRGGTIHFYLRLAEGQAFPWEAPELPAEGVVLEYSTDAGRTWRLLGAWDSADHRQWTPAQVAIPLPARTPATQFRWRQRSHSGLGFDHWALDDVWINANSIRPRLQIARSESQLVLRWPADWAGYSVEAADELPSPVWFTLETLPRLDADHAHYTVTLPVGSAHRFFRLVQR